MCFKGIQAPSIMHTLKTHERETSYILSIHKCIFSRQKCINIQTGHSSQYILAYLYMEFLFVKDSFYLSW